MKTTKGHVTYCTNIHAGESWPDHFLALQQNFPAIKKELSPNNPMGIGLRLSNVASIQLFEPHALEIFKEWLSENDAYVFTMNGFPYGGFHNTVVKDNVHTPDWLTDERVDYTIRLFNILVELLPAGMDGGISTSPLSYRRWFDSEEALEKATALATENLLKVVLHLEGLHATTGKLMHLDIEPEPDGILETGDEFLAWYNNHLLAMARHKLKPGLQVSEVEIESIVKHHVCLCYDVCHFAVGYEQHEQVIAQLRSHNIRIGKFQISAALKAQMPQDEAGRTSIVDAFKKFDEPTYLHQVIALQKDGKLLRYPDLSQALQDAENADVKEWRSHFHVPIFTEHFDRLQSTQSDIVEVLLLHKAQQLTQHIEVETYTWDVLPAALKLPIQQSIVREMQWLFRALED